MIEKVKTEPWHLYSLNNASYLLERKMVIRIDNFVKVCINESSITWMEDGFPIAATGIVPIWKGVGEIWAMLSKIVKGRPFKLHRSAAKIIDQFQMDGEYHRLQCVILKDFIDGIRWMKFLKFQCEGLLRAYGEDGSDYYRYARIF